MNTSGPRAWIAILLLPLLSACGTTPSSQHYLLTAPDAPMPTGTTPSVGVGPIVIPQYLNRDALVRRSNSNTLAISGTERWAEPLDDGVLRVLGLNLAGLLQTENIRLYPWHPSRPPEYGVKLRVVEMDSTPEEATLVAEWFVYNIADNSTLERSLSKKSAPLDAAVPDTNALVNAYGALLYDLSVEIAEVIRAAQEQGSDMPG